MIHKIVILLGMLFFSLPLLAVNKSIYGDDNRHYIHESNSAVLEFSLSVAAQISNKSILSDNGTNTIYSYQTIGESLNLCSDERFFEAPLLSSCTGFLVGPNLLMTAAHCVKDNDDCLSKSWVFDYEDKSDLYGNRNEVKIKNENKYSCKEIITSDHSVSENGTIDYTLIKLDRNVSNRPMLRINRFKIQKIGSNLSIIGHPLGLPKMAIDQFKITNNKDQDSFFTNADTFSGSSGSPVIDLNSKSVVGMLISGERDFVFDLDSNCNRSKKCLENSCRGEKAMRSQSFPLKAIPFHF